MLVPYTYIYGRCGICIIFANSFPFFLMLDVVSVSFLLVHGLCITSLCFIRVNALLFSLTHGLGAV